MALTLLTELTTDGSYSAQQSHAISKQNVHWVYPTGSGKHLYEQRAVADLLTAPFDSRVWAWGQTETRLGNVVPYDSIQGTGESYTGAGVSGDDYAARNGLVAGSAPPYAVINIEQWAAYAEQNLVTNFPWSGITSASEADVGTANQRFIETKLALASVLPAGVKVAAWNNFQFGALDEHLRAAYTSSAAQDDALRAQVALTGPKLGVDDFLISANYYGDSGNPIGQMNLIDKIGRLAHELYPEKEHFVAFWPYPASDPDTVLPINRVCFRKCIEYCDYLKERRGWPAGAIIWHSQPLASGSGRTWAEESWVLEVGDLVQSGRIYDSQIPLELR